MGRLPPPRLRGRIDLPSPRPPLAISPAQLSRDLRCPVLILGKEQLHSRVGPVEPPCSVDPRRQPERQVALVNLSRLAFSCLQQRPDPGPPRPPDLSQSTANQRPVLTHQRNDVGDGSQCNQVEVTVSRRHRGGAGGGLPGLAFARSSRGPHPRRPPQSAAELPGDRRPAQLLDRIAISCRSKNSAIGL